MSTVRRRSNLGPVLLGLAAASIVTAIVYFFPSGDAAGPKVVAATDADDPTAESLSPEQRDAEVRASNLRMMGLAIILYVDEHGRYPATLADAADFNPGVLERLRPDVAYFPPPNDLDAWTEWPMVFDAPTIEAGGDAVAILFTDGHVEVWQNPNHLAAMRYIAEHPSDSPAERRYAMPLLRTQFSLGRELSDADVDRACRQHDLNHVVWQLIHAAKRDGAFPARWTDLEQGDAAAFEALKQREVTYLPPGDATATSGALLFDAPSVEAGSGVAVVGFLDGRTEAVTDPTRLEHLLQEAKERHAP